MPPEEKRPFVQDLFTRIAPRYDLFNRLASCGMDAGWRREAMKQGAIQPGMRVLDLCTGTGDLALLAAKQAGRAGLVVGADMTAAMLVYAEQKGRGRGQTASWLCGDALCLPFADGQFDCITIGFSTRNFADLNSGLREIVRVLKRGGRLVILETGRPSNPIVRMGYHFFLNTGARLIGWALTGEAWPFTYLARSVEQFVTPEVFTERLRSLGTDVRFRPLSGGLVSLFVATKQERA